MKRLLLLPLLFASCGASAAGTDSMTSVEQSRRYYDRVHEQASEAVRAHKERMPWCEENLWYNVEERCEREYQKARSAVELKCARISSTPVTCTTMPFYHCKTQDERIYNACLRANGFEYK